MADAATTETAGHGAPEGAAFPADPTSKAPLALPQAP